MENTEREGEFYLPNACLKFETGLKIRSHDLDSSCKLKQQTVHALAMQQEKKNKKQLQTNVVKINTFLLAQKENVNFELPSSKVMDEILSITPTTRKPIRHPSPKNHPNIMT